VGKNIAVQSGLGNARESFTVSLLNSPVVDAFAVPGGDTVASLSQRMAYSDAQEERFRVLNALGSRDGVTPGQKVKLVVRAR